MKPTRVELRGVGVQLCRSLYWVFIISLFNMVFFPVSIIDVHVISNVQIQLHERPLMSESNVGLKHELCFVL